MKILAAGVRISMDCCHENFFENRFMQYQANFPVADLSISTVIEENIMVPAGKTEQVGRVYIVRYDDGTFCTMHKHRANGMVTNAVYHNGNYSKVEIHLLHHRNYPHMDSRDWEYLYTGTAFADKLAFEGGAVIHGSAVAYQNRCYIFAANSGTGKSTHASLWQQYFPGQVEIINDDKPAIRIENGMPVVYGTPWSGKTDLHCNRRVPLGAVLFLEQAPFNAIRRLDVKESVFALTGQIARPYYDAALGEKTLDVVECLVNTTPMYRLSCNMSLQAVETACNVLLGGDSFENCKRF